MSKFKLFRLIGKYLSLSALRKFFEFNRFYISGLLHRLDEHHVFLSGGGIAFSLLISVIPFVLIIFAVLGNIIDVSTVEAQVNTLIDTIIPYPEAAAYTKRFILSRIPEVIEYKTLAGYLGAFGLFFTSTWLFSSMRTILNRIFGVTKERNAFIGLLRDFGMVLLLLVFVSLLTFILPIINIIVNAADRIQLLEPFRISQLSDTLFSIISVGLIFALFLVSYYFIPYEKLGRRVPAVSALWATILWELMRNLFGYYVSDFLSVNKVYEAFLLIVIVIFWIFYSSVLFVIGAEIGQLYRERRMLLNGRNGFKSKNK
ncbi:YihY/virulence factor BrkB family protein [Bacteroidota bacterium]